MHVKLKINFEKEIFFDLAHPVVLYILQCGHHTPGAQPFIMFYQTRYTAICFDH